MIERMPGDIFAAGQLLNNTYEILGVLGRGGTGEVYLARNQIVNREVAIKALNSQFSDNEDYLELMKREEQMRDIIHDAVVRYSECSRSDQGHVFLVMEFVDGVSLSDLMMDRRIDEKELLIIAHRVLEGLVPVHKHKIVHRDLSPDNIILRGGDPERATIIDFGIAKDTSAGARTIVGNDFAGKYEYAAPEQLDGHSEYRTDLYALGASLLAAYRREIPFLGATPGEIIRRKQDPLDTDGVRQPLKDLIDWLAAPEIQERPKDATDALERLGAKYLKTPKIAQSGRRQPRQKRSARLLWLAAPVIAIIGGVVLWVNGTKDSLPTASPYRFSTSFDDGGTTTLSGNAPNTETAQAIIETFVQITGQSPVTKDLILADGMPSPEWPDQMRELMNFIGKLETWKLNVVDEFAEIGGVAPDVATRNKLKTELETWSAKTGIAVNPSLIAGPVSLPVAQVQSMLSELETCGLLSLTQYPATSYALYDTITITGDIANPEDEMAISNALLPRVGDRKIRLDTVTLNDDLCAIRNALPVAETANLSIWLGEGGTGQPMLAGVFTTNQNPLVEVHVPADVVDGSLWVMVVDNTGKVFHVLPNVNQTEHNISKLGRVRNGVRHVRVLHSVEEFIADNSKLAMRVNEGEYGKSEIVAILTRDQLFDLRRPRDESVTSVVEAMTEAFEGREAEIIGVASRIIDARP